MKVIHLDVETFRERRNEMGGEELREAREERIIFHSLELAQFQPVSTSATSSANYYPRTWEISKRRRMEMNRSEWKREMKLRVWVAQKNLLRIWLNDVSQTNTTNIHKIMFKFIYVEWTTPIMSIDIDTWLVCVPWHGALSALFIPNFADENDFSHCSSVERKAHSPRKRHTRTTRTMKNRFKILCSYLN